MMHQGEELCIVRHFVLRLIVGISRQHELTSPLRGRKVRSVTGEFGNQIDDLPTRLWCDGDLCKTLRRQASKGVSMKAAS